MCSRGLLICLRVPVQCTESVSFSERGGGWVLVCLKNKDSSIPIFWMDKPFFEGFIVTCGCVHLWGCVRPWVCEGPNVGTSIILNTFFSSCNLKQWNIRYFNTNRKKFSVRVNFIQKEAKTAPKRVLLFFQFIKKFSATFRRIPIILEDYSSEIFSCMRHRRCPIFFLKNKEKTKKEREKKRRVAQQRVYLTEKEGIF